MALSTEEQALYDLMKTSLPAFFFQKDGARFEQANAFVKIFDQARQLIAAWRNYTFILSAIGTWLDQHAKDRGTFRQNNETDAALRTRLRTVEDAVNPASIRAAATAALEVDSVTIPTGYPGLVELRRDRANLGTWSASPTASGATASTKMAYISRGYRMGSRGLTIIVILPYGTSAATAASVNEAVRRRKAGGIHHLTERRLNP